MGGAQCVHGEARKRDCPGRQVNRFNPSQVVAMPGALAALEASGESLLTANGLKGVPLTRIIS
jgi:hypothetical protein